MSKRAPPLDARLCVIRRSPTDGSRRTYKIFSPRLIAGRGGPVKAIHAEALPTRKRMLRYILAFSFLFLLGGVACAAAIAADAPTLGRVAFLVCLGLFAAALAGGVAERRSRRPE
jgi:peptidoglycan/LPS O-acetylase OafA/YrhL